MFFIFTCLVTLTGAQASEFWTELGKDFASPVTTQAETPLIAGSASTFVFYLLHYDIGDPLQKSWSNDKPLGDASRFGDYAGQLIPNALYAASFGIDYWATQNTRSRSRALLMIKASLYSGAVTTGLKYAFAEPRPNNSDLLSFPSGHATSAFAFAAVVGAEHEWYWGLAAYSLATFVAASRINDNMHRLHDVIGGATIGLSYGLGLYYRQAKPSSQAIFQILPTGRLDGFLVTMTREYK